MSQAANDIIRNHVYWAVAAGSVPLPIVDLVAVTGIQLDMLKQLAGYFQVPYSEEQAKSWLSALSASMLARLGANAVKLIPGVGSLIGGVTMAVLSGASTYALGRVAAEHLSERGSFDDLDLAAAKARYDAAYEEGKRVAREAKESGKAAPRAEGAPAGSPLDQLERLAALHAAGALTDAEFTAAKAKILG